MWVPRPGSSLTSLVLVGTGRVPNGNAHCERWARAAGGGGRRRHSARHRAAAHASRRRCGRRTFADVCTFPPPNPLPTTPRDDNVLELGETDDGCC
jgi:hypothetical protein